MADKINGASDEAVKKATGKDWSEWVKVIDALGGADMTHREIVIKLYEKNLGSSGWWRQMITVGYEKLKGRRKLGETADAGFEVGVHKTVAAGADSAWDFLLSPQGLKLWLGRIDELKLEPKAPYQTGDGVKGEIKTFKTGEFIRMTWQPAGAKASTTLQLRLAATGPGKTRLSFHHEKLSGPKAREEMQSHWRKVLGRIESAVSR
jgi:uncharacterized protein YndB with AHSA1/START domain